MVLDSICVLFLIESFDFVKNVIFGVENTLPTHDDTTKKSILVLGEGLTQGLDDNSRA